MYTCTVCGNKCHSDSQLCYKHNPDSKKKAQERVNRYRKTDKGKEVVKAINQRQRKG